MKFAIKILRYDSFQKLGLEPAEILQKSELPNASLSNVFGSLNSNVPTFIFLPENLVGRKLKIGRQAAMAMRITGISRSR